MIYESLQSVTKRLSRCLVRGALRYRHHGNITRYYSLSLVNLAVDVPSVYIWRSRVLELAYQLALEYVMISAEKTFNLALAGVKRDL